MKKLLSISALLLSLMAFAGPKADIEAAQKLINENKTSEAIELLKNTKNVKGEEESYAIINNYLAEQSLDPLEQINYYEISSNATKNSPASLEANYRLSELAVNDNERLKYLEQLVSRTNGANATYLAIYMEALKTAGKVKEYEAKLEEVSKNKDKEFTGNVYLILSRLFNSDVKLRDEFLNKALGLNNNYITSQVYFEKAGIELEAKNTTKAEELIDKAVSVSSNDENVLYIAYRLYLSMNNMTKAYTTLENVYKINSKEVSYVQELYLLATKLKKTADITKYEKKLVADYKISSLELGYLLLSNEEYDSAIKKLRVSLSQERDVRAYYYLAIAYLEKGDYKSAKIYATNASKNGLDAKELLNEITKKENEAKKK